MGRLVSNSNYSLKFDGAYSTEVQFDNLHNLNNSDGDYITVSFWMDWNDGDACMPISLKYYDLVFDFNAFGFNHSVGDIYGVSDTLLDGGWHHVTAVFYDAQGYENAHDFEKLYIDGVAQSLSYQKNPNAGLGIPTPNNVNFSFQELKIGTIYPWDNLQFNGNMDELSIWNGEVCLLKYENSKPTVNLLEQSQIWLDIGIWKMDLAPLYMIKLPMAITDKLQTLCGQLQYLQINTCNNCSATDSIYVNITPQDDASFTYSASSYCSDDTDPSPTISGTTGGTFSSTSGLVMTNGVIDLDASTAGTYTITYTTSGTCTASSTQDITITAPTTDFNYGGDTVFCQGGVNPVATITGDTAGIFTSSSGLVIDP